MHASRAEAKEGMRLERESTGCLLHDEEEV